MTSRLQTTNQPLPRSEPRPLRTEDDVVEAIEASGGTTNRMRWVWILALGGVFFEAYSSTALSSALAPLTRQLSLGATQVSVLTSLSMLVALVLCPVAGRLSDRFGRVPMILLAKGMAVGSAVFAVAVPGYGLLLVSRVLAGTAWALDFAVVMAYIAEFLPARHQGRLNRWQGMWYIATSCNLLLTVAIYALGVGESIWRYSLASSGVIALVLGLTQLAVLPESPPWLAARGRVRQASAVLRSVYVVDVEEPAHDCTPVSRGESASGQEGWTALFIGEHRRRTLLAGITFMMQGLEYYAIGWYLPVIALQLFGKDFAAATLGSVFFNLFGIVGGFGSTYVAARLRIRRSMQLGFAAITVLVLLLGFFFHGLPVWAAVTIPALFLLCHSGGPAPGGASLAALAYPSHLRAMGSGMTNTCGCIGGAIGLFVFPMLQSSLGSAGAILVIAVAPLIGLVTSTVIRWDPEAQAARQDRVPPAQAGMPASAPSGTPGPEIPGSGGDTSRSHQHDAAGSHHP